MINKIRLQKTHWKVIYKPQDNGEQWFNTLAHLCTLANLEGKDEHRGKRKNRPIIYTSNTKKIKLKPPVNIFKYAHLHHERNMN